MALAVELIKPTTAFFNMVHVVSRIGEVLQDCCQPLGVTRLQSELLRLECRCRSLKPKSYMIVAAAGVADSFTVARVLQRVSRRASMRWALPTISRMTSATGT